MIVVVPMLKVCVPTLPLPLPEVAPVIVHVSVVVFVVVGLLVATFALQAIVALAVTSPGQVIVGAEQSFIVIPFDDETGLPQPLLTV